VKCGDYSPIVAVIGDKMAEAFVLDTSALLALRSDEVGAERVAEILRLGRRGRAKTFLSFMTRMEILYRVTASEGEEAARTALRLIDAAGVSWVSCEPEILDVAARFKAGGGLSVADAWIAATAATRHAVLVHKDPEFVRVREVPQERL
jgi:predicted nucleic acid-binding protein